MNLIEISYPLFVLWLLALGGLIAFLCYYTAKCRALRREKDATAKAYAELVAGSAAREAVLLTEKQMACVRMHVAEEDADRLAPIVAQFLKDIDETSALLKDETPPAMAKERNALRLHLDALNLRTSHEKQPSSV